MEHDLTADDDWVIVMLGSYGPARPVSRRLTVVGRQARRRGFESRPGRFCVIPEPTATRSPSRRRCVEDLRFMLPKPPARRPQLGFLYLPPYRVQGLSIAGEQSVVYVPELDLAFDIGGCPKAVLPADTVALTHGHMDHVAAIAYYFSQRQFQGMGPGKVVCPPRLEAPLNNLMKAWIEIEHQRTPYELIPLEPGTDLPLKGNMVLRSFPTDHRVPSQGYSAVELRSKLKPEYEGLPQPELVRLKQEGQEITQTLQIPLVTYTGDTAAGPHLDIPEVMEAKVLITECTFLEPGHRGRAKVGRHMHLDDIVALLEHCKAEHIVLTHLSRRTNMNTVRRELSRRIPKDDMDRVHVLMDNRTNKARYEQQLDEAEAQGD